MYSDMYLFSPDFSDFSIIHVIQFLTQKKISANLETYILNILFIHINTSVLMVICFVAIFLRFGLNFDRMTRILLQQFSRCFEDQLYINQSCAYYLKFGFWWLMQKYQLWTKSLWRIKGCHFCLEDTSYRFQFKKCLFFRSI